MSIRNKPKKTDIRLRAGPWPNNKAAQAELNRAGYTPRPEANDLPLKFERATYPALTIWSDDQGKTWLIGEYPTDLQILQAMPGRIENPKHLSDKWDTGAHMKDGTIIDVDDKKWKGK